jgi:hypothetical protein
VAGGWALWTWNQATAPSLKTGLQLSGDIKASWSRLSKTCLSELTITVENVGQRTGTVSKVTYIVAKAKPEKLSEQEKIRVLETLPATAEVIANRDLDPPLLARQYPPKAKWSFNLIFEHQRLVSLAFMKAYMSTNLIERPLSTIRRLLS